MPFLTPGVPPALVARCARWSWLAHGTRIFPDHRPDRSCWCPLVLRLARLRRCSHVPRLARRLRCARGSTARSKDTVLSYGSARSPCTAHFGTTARSTTSVLSSHLGSLLYLVALA